MIIIVPMPILNVYDTGTRRSTTLSAGANKCHQWLVTSAKPPSLSTSWHQICLAQGMNAPQQAVSLQNSPTPGLPPSMGGEALVQLQCVPILHSLDTRMYKMIKKTHQPSP